MTKDFFVKNHPDDVDGDNDDDETDPSTLDTLSELSGPTESASSSVHTPQPSSARDKKLGMLAEQMLSAMKHAKTAEPPEPKDDDSKVSNLAKSLKDAFDAAQGSKGGSLTPEKSSKEPRVLPTCVTWKICQCKNIHSVFFACSLVLAQGILLMSILMLASSLLDLRF